MKVVVLHAGVLLAFAEARINTCADCAELGIALRRSHDGGLTWGSVTWPVPPTPTGTGHEMARGGNPTVVWDSRYKLGSNSAKCCFKLLLKYLDKNCLRDILYYFCLQETTSAAPLQQRHVRS